MNIRTKKIIAKEFLYLLFVFALGVVCFLSIYAYNFYLYKQGENLNKTILQKQKVADSLNKLIAVKNDPFKEFGGREITPAKRFSVDQFAQMIKTKYPEYKKIDNRILVEKVIAKYPIYQESVDLTSQNISRDSIDGLPILKKKKSTKENWDNYLEINIPIKTSLPTPPPYKIWKESEQIKSELSKEKIERNQIDLKVLSFNDQFLFTCKALILFFIILFGIRYLYYAFKWSTTTLKE